MSITLQREDFDRLIGILTTLPEWRREQTRWDFMDDVFMGTGYKDSLQGLLDLSGSGRVAGVRAITRLTQFGQGDPGEETLGVMINRMQSYMGGGADADFLKGLFDKYPLKGDPAAMRGMPEEDIRYALDDDDVAEKVIGENTLRHINFLQMAIAMSDSVIRIKTDTKGKGTGFVVGENLIMTNHHVIDTHSEGKRSAFEFFYQLDLNDELLDVETVQAKPNGLFYTSPRNVLDFTVIELENTPGRAQILKLRPERARKQDRVTIIQHPGGGYKKFSMQNNFVEYADAKVLQYLTTTEPGSSGSPVFNNRFQVIGIHHSGGKLPEPGSRKRFLRNAGSSMIAVLDELKANAPDIYSRLTIV
ncbi:MAG: trypsin-like peptidase domain-containing protein [Chloroflexota bacterium]